MICLDCFTLDRELMMGAAACIALNRIASVWSARIDRPSCYFIGLLINEDIESRTCPSNQSRSNRFRGVDFQVARPPQANWSIHIITCTINVCKQIPTINNQPTHQLNQPDQNKQPIQNALPTNPPKNLLNLLLPPLHPPPLRSPRRNRKHTLNVRR